MTAMAGKGSVSGGSQQPSPPPVPEAAAELASALAADVHDSVTEEAVTRVYLAVLRNAQPTTSLLVAQGMEASQVDLALDLLESRGLVRLHPGGRIEVLPPDISLPALATSFERRARETRSAAHELAQVFFAARAQSRAPDRGAVQVLTNLDEVAEATAEIVAAGRERIRTFRTLSPRTREIFDSPTHAHEQPSRGVDGRPLAYTSVYDAKVLELEHILEVLRAREKGGERTRFSNAVPFSAVIVDDTAAVVDLSDYDPTGFGSLLVRARPMVAALVVLADQIWDRGRPLTPEGARAQSRDQTILALLAAGTSDATIARQTGVSQRTVERRVRSLMDELGAATRFQAGVEAVRRGLI